ncbi:uncharacterized protein LOC131249802 [Magnolia sinica]|uniref:uncharacterized protein LOC131249802 n=1 Tax=Magnolia sinica TaxID=86752 RepID=UPI002658C87F|nr:uncharacterized protein LOC131249802 [Magnolia sinica]
MWKKQIDKIFMVMKCDEYQKAELAIYMLEGEADHWWDSVIRMNPRVEVWTWAQFCEKFDDKYFPLYVKNQKAGEFMKLEQGDMTVRQYDAKFTELSRFATFLVSDETRKAQKFEEGLRASIRSRLAPFVQKTYAEVLERALAVEKDINEYWKNRDQRRDVKSGARTATHISPAQQDAAKRQRTTSISMARPTTVLPPPRFSGFCYNCGLEGHTSRFCSRPQRTQYPQRSGSSHQSFRPPQQQTPPSMSQRPPLHPSASQPSSRPPQPYPQRPLQSYSRPPQQGPSSVYQRPPPQVKPQQYQQSRQGVHAPRPQAQGRVYTLVQSGDDTVQLYKNLAQQYEGPIQSYDVPAQSEDGATQICDDATPLYEDPASPKMTLFSLTSRVAAM